MRTKCKGKDMKNNNTMYCDDVKKDAYSIYNALLFHLFSGENVIKW